MAANEITVTLRGDTAEVDRIVQNALALTKQNEILREALEWYADSANWKRMPGRADMGPKSWGRPAAVIDKGARAKFILTQLSHNAQS